MKTKQVLTNLTLVLAGGLVVVGGNQFFKEDKKIVERTVIQQPKAKLVNYDGETIAGALDFTTASQASLNSVVHITTEATQKYRSEEEAFLEQFFGGRSAPRVQRGSGSGVILSQSGYIVTNNHVIDGSDKVEVTLNDNRKYEAKIIGTDPGTDLAVIKIDEKDLQAIELGNSDEVEVGEWVLAVGNPFNLTSTVTAGIVSAKARSINIMERSRDKEIFPIESFIQTDAAVNPGNSGGALVNTNGELVGINTAIASRTGSYAGYSFAVPVNLMKKVTGDLIKHGVVQRAFIGVNILELNQDVANELQVTQTEGVYVSGLMQDGAAENAGIREGDVIISINNVEVKSVPALQEQVGKHQPGDKVSVGLYRKDEFKTLPVTLKNIEGTTDVIERKELASSELGARLKEVSSSDKSKLKIDYGVKLDKLSKGKLSDLGFEEGFIITHIDGKKVEKPEEVENKLKNTKGKEVIIKGVQPNGVRVMYQISM